VRGILCYKKRFPVRLKLNGNVREEEEKRITVPLPLVEITTLW